MTRTSIRRTLGLTVAAGLVLASTIGAQGIPQAPAGRPDAMAAMMAQRQTMMAEMTASQKKLDDLVAKMNTATGQAKVDQMAVVITELVAQHRGMQGRMMSMQGGMMKQMMQPGAAPPADAPPAGHEQHHQ